LKNKNLDLRAVWLTIVDENKESVADNQKNRGRWSKPKQESDAKISAFALSVANDSNSIAAPVF
jgi:hypothetical protein